MFMMNSARVIWVSLFMVRSFLLVGSDQSHTASVSAGGRGRSGVQDGFVDLGVMSTISWFRYITLHLLSSRTYLSRTR